MQTIASEKTRRMSGLFAVLCLFAPIAFAADEAIVIDHTCTDIGKIPPSYIEKAAKTCKVAYGHTSHGSQIVSGMAAMRKADPDRFGFGEGKDDGLSFKDCTPAGDLGNPDRRTWARRTREYLNTDGKDRNVIVWSWCGQAGSASQEDMQTYLNLMGELEKDFPDVTFVYMTGHLDGTGKDGNLNRRNEQIREFCGKNGKVLFDFADIESFDPDGNVNYMELYATDSCNYEKDGVTRNWADDWLKNNPDHAMALPDSAAHTRPLNGALKGRAFWWMMARLAGWDGTPETTEGTAPGSAEAE